MNQLFKQRIAFRKYGEKMVAHARGAQLLLTPEVRERVVDFMQNNNPDVYGLTEHEREMMQSISVTMIALVLDEKFDNVSALIRAVYTAGVMRGKQE